MSNIEYYDIQYAAERTNNQQHLGTEYLIKSCTGSNICMLFI